MFTINKNYGIGEVIEMTDTMVKVYFADEDLTKSLLKSFTTIYRTIEEAELALNPELTEDEKDEILANIEEEKRIMSEGRAASQRLEEINLEASRKLMRNI